MSIDEDLVCDQDELHLDTDGSSDEFEPFVSPPSARPRRRFLGTKYHRYLLFFIVAGLDSTVFVLNLPLTRVYESIACYQYYSAHEPGRFSNPASIPEQECKIASVQQELARVKGIEFLFMMAPVRQRGEGVWTQVVMNNDNVTMQDADKSRATTFLQLTVAVLISQAISTPLASVLMAKHGTTLPIAFGYGLGLSVCFMCPFVPETIHLSTSKTADGEQPPGEAGTASLHATKQGRKARMRGLFASKGSSRVSVWLLSPAVLASLVILFVDSFNAATINIVVQYASKKLSIPISSVGSLVTIRAVVTIVIILVVVPHIGRRLEAKRGLDSHSRDLWLARITMSVCPLGFALLATGRSVAVIAAGMVLVAVSWACCNSLVRSIATAMVSPERISGLYGVVNVFQAVGALVGNPLLAELLAMDIKSGNDWISLPFGLAGVLSILSSAIIWAVRLPPTTAN
ncbi:Major facilitator superfamily domain, general substrate transporter [Metarhizium album ARSEF 1941]|uniref:Major facilitator superfamily domain, general substrate transporter n=1 Tax=Metarhizium album (strain ARSEF 1941) TaxID=1081103 RepID=A0A0B2WH11_METAS|nr:Major facilitator superfamily domain, general substrate transporter [Metarhizium album ARSEF 1941]KHN95271.1 Major facilitator superfamily domain, general substrate transporter [Metarhizium album ARSEF 1941]